MELGTTYIVLSYVGPLCGIVGFIITPGMTHIRPWLMEKLSKKHGDIVKDTLSKDYNSMDFGGLIKEHGEFKRKHKFDLRKKIRTRRKELKNVLDSKKIDNNDILY